MQFRFCAPSALLVAVAALAGCSSGGGGATAKVTFACSGDNAKALCLNNCSLGCSSTGCLRTDIAQNEILVLQFSKDIDPRSVNTSTIRLRTASGELPVGEFYTNGNQVEFVPTLLTSGGQTFFGFRPGETYTMTLPGGPDQSVTVRSTSGDAFFETLTCSLAVTQGIVDHNHVPPSAELVSPTQSQLSGAPLDTVIRLDFNEMVDATPFLAATGGDGPVSFTVRRTVGSGASRQCDLGSTPQTLVGTSRLDFDAARNVSVLTFRTNQDLSPNTCVEIVVTSTVVDLAGNPASSQVFTFLTEAVPLTEDAVTESFISDAQLDRDASSGSWSGGHGHFGKIGGDGRHGTFSVNLGTRLPAYTDKETYQINTNSTIIPAENTRTGTAMAVSDGKFFFDQLVLLSNQRLRFIGDVPPQITVCGKLDIQGELDLAGGSITTAGTPSGAGQAGGAAGIFGGAGGAGGSQCNGLGALPANNGHNGGDASVLGGRAYASSIVGSGGRGSSVFPVDGLNASVNALLGVTAGVAYSPGAAAGGGGGGNLEAGGIGRVITNNHNDPNNGNVPPLLSAMGPSAAGGLAVQYFPFPPTSGSTRSSLHFLVGGAGGGGAGSHSALGIGSNGVFLSSQWSAGNGGGGGGGAIALRAGDWLSIGAQGRILANGGRAADSILLVGSGAACSVGGGGSGGSVVLQAGRAADINGLIDVRGGVGGQFNRGTTTAAPAGSAVQIAGGNGSPGFVRCEVPGTPTVAMLSTMLPAATVDNVGTLTEVDDLDSFQSLWYSTGLPFGPDMVRYEIRATVDGVATLFSDDPTVPSSIQAGVGTPLRVSFQAANLDLTTGLPVPLPGETNSIRPWRTSVLSTGSQTGIASDGMNGFRFAFVVDHTLATTVTIEQVKVFYLH